MKINCQKQPIKTIYPNIHQQNLIQFNNSSFILDSSRKSQEDQDSKKQNQKIADQIQLQQYLNYPKNSQYFKYLRKMQEEKEQQEKSKIITQFNQEDCFNLKSFRSAPNQNKSQKLSSRSPNFQIQSSNIIYNLDNLQYLNNIKMEQLKQNFNPNFEENVNFNKINNNKDLINSQKQKSIVKMLESKMNFITKNLQRNQQNLQDFLLYSNKQQRITLLDKSDQSLIICNNNQFKLQNESINKSKSRLNQIKRFEVKKQVETQENITEVIKEAQKSTDNKKQKHYTNKIQQEGWDENYLKEEQNSFIKYMEKK